MIFHHGSLDLHRSSTLQQFRPPALIPAPDLPTTMDNATGSFRSIRISSLPPVKRRGRPELAQRDASAPPTEGRRVVLRPRERSREPLPRRNLTTPISIDTASASSAAGPGPRAEPVAPAQAASSGSRAVPAAAAAASSRPVTPRGSVADEVFFPEATTIPQTEPTNFPAVHAAAPVSGVAKSYRYWAPHALQVQQEHWHDKFFLADFVGKHRSTPLKNS